MRALLFSILLILQAACLQASEVYVSNPEVKGNKVSFSLWTDDKMTKPITFKMLKTIHTEKIHALIIDDSLNHYTHTHPAEVKGKPGYYEFDWKPDSETTYKLWLDMELNDAKDQKPFYTILQKGKIKGAIDKKEVLKIKDGDFEYTVIFEEDPVADTSLMAKLIIHEKGKQFNKLEPYLGAYSHIVLYGEDFESYFHTHPMGKEPKSDNERGKGEIMFHIEKLKKGFVKMFVQVKINGKVVTLPFGFNVN